MLDPTEIKELPSAGAALTSDAVLLTSIEQLPRERSSLHKLGSEVLQQTRSNGRHAIRAISVGTRVVSCRSTNSTGQHATRTLHLRKDIASELA